MSLLSFPLTGSGHSRSTGFLANAERSYKLHPLFPENSETELSESRKGAEFVEIYSRLFQPPQCNGPFRQAQQRAAT